MSLGGNQAPVLPPKGSPVISTQILTSMTGRAPNWFLNFLQVSLCNQDSLPGVHEEATPSVRSTGPLAGTAVPTS
jgi:hypothetical protein